jgi:hypothetical protein
MPSGGHNAVPFDQDAADDLCEWIADGKSLKSWIEINATAGGIRVGGRPLSARVIYRWVATVETFAAAYAAAREDRADTLVDEILEIADNASDDAYIRYVDGKPFAAIDGTSIRRAEVMIKTRQWIAEKMKPASYGNRLDVTSGGRAIGAPVKDAAERLHQIMMAAMARQAGEIVPAVTVDAKFVEVEALPSPVPTMDDLLS